MTVSNSAPEAALPIAIGGRLFRRIRGRVVTYWRAPTVQIRDEEALVVALSTVAIPFL